MTQLMWPWHAMIKAHKMILSAHSLWINNFGKCLYQSKHCKNCECCPVSQLIVSTVGPAPYFYSTVSWWLRWPFGSTGVLGRNDNLNHQFLLLWREQVSTLNNGAFHSRSPLNNSVQQCFLDDNKPFKPWHAEPIKSLAVCEGMRLHLLDFRTFQDF